MKRKITAILAILMFFMFVALAYGAKNIQVDFEYSQPAESFRLYMDGAVICTDVTAGTMTCNDIAIDYGVHQFTMTAVSGGIESLHSPAYLWSYSPVQGPGPAFINFNVTLEDGSVVPLGSVKLDK